MEIHILHCVAMDFYRYNSENFPDLESMLTSMIRIMSCFVRQPSESQIMTLLHLMECIKHHPDFSSHPAVNISISQAREIWQEQLRLSQQQLSRGHGKNPMLN